MASIAEFLAWLKLASLASSAALAVILLLRKPLRRAFGAVTAYALWLLLPASLAGSVWPAREVLVAMPTSQTLIPAMIGESDFTAAAFDATPWWFALWGIGGLSMLITFAWQQHRFMRGLGRIAPDQAGCWRAEANAGLPALIGVLRPRIVLPADFDIRYDATERCLMLHHESAHRRSFDGLCNAVMALFRALFWFNPLLHWAAARYRHDQELACDARVIANQPEKRRAYASAMLKTQLASESLPLGCHWGQTHPLKERVMQIQKALPEPRLRRGGLLLASILAIGAAFAAWAAQPPTMTAAGASLPDTQGDYRLTVQMRVDGGAPRDFAIGERYGNSFEFEHGDVRVTGTVKPVRHRGKLAFRVQTRVLRKGEMPRSPMLVMANNHPAQIQLGEEARGGGFKGVDMTLLILPRDAQASLGMAEEMEAVAAPPVPAAPPALSAPPAPSAPLVQTIDNIEFRGDFVRKDNGNLECAGVITIDKAKRVYTCKASEGLQAKQASAGAIAATHLGAYSIGRIIPRYPPDAMQAGVTGSVKIRVDIAPDGSVRDSKIMSATPPGVFDQATMDAVKQARFRVPAEHRKSGFQGWLQIDYTLE